MSHIDCARRPRALRRTALVLLCAAAAGLGFPSARAAAASPHAAAAPVAATSADAATALRFEPNAGQTDARVRFLARGAGYGFFLTDTAAVVSLDGADGARALRMRFEGASAPASVAGERELAGRATYVTGSAPALDVPTFGAVRYAGLYPGVDALFYGNRKSLEYDFVVAPGADASAIRLGVDGADRLSVDAAGDLRIAAGDRELVQRAPVAYQLVDGARRSVACAYEVDGTTVRLVAGDYDRSRELVIDPVLNYSTYLGGSGFDRVNAIAVDSLGAAYVAGVTASNDFPTQFGLPIASHNRDAFVAKLNPAGSALVFSTYLGGADDDSATALTIDANGVVYVAGVTKSADFPSTNGAFSRRGADDDVFVARLAADGRTLTAASSFGGTGVDDVAAIAVDSAGAIYLTGATNSTDFPTQLPIQISSGGGDRDAFITKMSAGATSLVYSTYFGGSARDEGEGVAVDSSGNVVIAGFTASTNFPTRRPLQAANAGGRDAFVASINSTGTDLNYSTFLGGTFNDTALALALGPGGSIYIAGQSFSDDFPTNGSIGTNAGNGDAFVAELDASAANLTFSTFLGGGQEDQANAIAVDSLGAAYVTGFTASANFPTKLPLQIDSGDANNDAFVTKINSSGTRLAYSTYFGGNDSDTGTAIAVDGSGNAYVAGVTSSTNLPQQSAIFGDRGGDDGFVAKIGNSFVDLSLAIAATPEPVRSGANLTYTITVTNNGPDVAGNVTARMNTPLGTTFVSATVPGGTCTTPEVGGTGEVACTVPSLASGASAVFTVVVKVVADTGATVNASATVTTTATDTTTTNDTASTTSTVLAPVDPPVITAVSRLTDPVLKIRIDGSNFQPGVQVFVGTSTTPWPSIKVKGTTRITLKGDVKTAFPKNIPVQIRVVNPDGGEATTTYTR